MGGYRILSKVALIGSRLGCPASSLSNDNTRTPSMPMHDTDADGFFSRDESSRNGERTLPPPFLAADMHGIDNIDNGGTLSLAGTGLALTNKDQRLTASEEEIKDGVTAHDASTKNVGDLKVGRRRPIAFNHLTGHFTEALSSTASGGSDQTASWGGTPIVRPAVSNTANKCDVLRRWDCRRHSHGLYDGRLLRSERHGFDAHC